jgi:hypothetical protein
MQLAMRRLVKFDYRFALLKIAPLNVPGYSEHTMVQMAHDIDLF